MYLTPLLNSSARWFSKNLGSYRLRVGANIARCPYTIRQTTTTTLVAKSLPKPGPQKLVGRWLLTCGGMVYVAIALGGVTRLTESGLSMVSWNFFGERFPTSNIDWKNEFEKYQLFPEYKLKNRSITLDEFKFIFCMEYLHRMWGRAIGVVFTLPAIYFWHKNYFCSSTKRRVLLMGALIGVQGLLGWYMVKSGLEDRFQNPNDVPRVSQYRLASHLSTAFILYALFLSNAFKKLLSVENTAIAYTSAIGRVKGMAIAAKSIIFLTAISGAFVAGLDAGLVYNSFPKMGDQWIPNDVLALKPVLKNFTENPTTVQLDHRILGISTLLISSALFVFAKKSVLPKRVQNAVNLLAFATAGQVTLGILTLLNYVPISLATAHQSGSIFLLSTVLWLRHELKYLKYIPK